MDPRTPPPESGSKAQPRGLPASIPGFTESPERYAGLIEEQIILEKVLAVKDGRPDLPPLAVIQGGTGTGKSTVMNALCGKELSRAGVTRPMTRGPLLFGPAAFFPALSEFFPQGSFTVMPEGAELPLAGAPEEIQALGSGPGFPALLCDCPDLDSVLAEHEKAARRLFLCADHLLFVVTAEKYADAAGCDFLAMADRAGFGISLVVNKATRAGESVEIREDLARYGIGNIGRVFEIRARKPAAEPAGLSMEPFAVEARAFFSDRAKEMKKEGLRAARLMRDRTARELSDILAAEKEQLKNLEALLGRALSQAREQLSARLSPEADPAARARIKQKLGAMFRKYDFLYPVRGGIGKMLRGPARLLGLSPLFKKDAPEALPHFPRLDPGPLWYALAEYQSQVGREISQGPFFQALEQEAPQMEPDQAREILNEKLAGIDEWLSTRFAELEKGIPKRKKAGIYGLSLSWGALIVSVESLVGGGFTVLDAALDSVLAPLVTAGALEMFVKTEVKALARSLAERIREAMDQVLVEQHERYAALLSTLRPA